MGRVDRGRCRGSVIVWIGFLVVVLAVLAADLGVLHRRPHEPTTLEALTFAGATLILALAFAAFLFVAYDAHWFGLGSAVTEGRPHVGVDAAVTFLTGYVVELSLSLDNVFVIAVLFAHLRIPRVNQHRVLFWGVLGALVMRGAIIAGGTALLARYHWVTYLLGAFLVFTAARMLISTPAAEEPDERWLVAWLNRHFRVSADLHGDRFTIVKDGVRWLTPLAVALVLVETTDLVFAVDSIPAVFAVTNDPLIVFTSNVFAILCLRSLYFGLANLIDRFRHLHTSLAVVLAIIGIKMLAADYVDRALGDAGNLVTLGLVMACLGGGILASLRTSTR